ncbi:MAG: XrtA/PEP-CTERM system exopolysaccharide export protein [Pseudomonadota bacterium]
MIRVLAIAALALLAACAQQRGVEQASVAGIPTGDKGAYYLIGPGDVLQVFVWRNPDLTVTVPVRPDGRISVPLIEDLVVTGKTPTAVGHDIEQTLQTYVQDPIVTVIVSNFVGPFTQQVRVVGEAAQPQAVPYRDNMSVLDVMIASGGLTRFAAGNRAVIAARWATARRRKSASGCRICSRTAI